MSVIWTKAHHFYERAEQFLHLEVTATSKKCGSTIFLMWWHSIDASGNGKVSPVSQFSYLYHLTDLTHLRKTAISDYYRLKCTQSKSFQNSNFQNIAVLHTNCTLSYKIVIYVKFQIFETVCQGRISFTLCNLVNLLKHICLSFLTLWQMVAIV